MVPPLPTLLLQMGTILWTRGLISHQMGPKARRHLMQWLEALLPSSC